LIIKYVKYTIAFCILFFLVECNTEITEEQDCHGLAFGLIIMSMKSRGEPAYGLTSKQSDEMLFSGFLLDLTCSDKYEGETPIKKILD